MGLYFQGKICKYSHSGIRYTNSRECVECCRLKGLKYIETRRNYRNKRKNNPEYIEKQAEAQRKWRKKDPKRGLFRTAQSRAKEKGLDFNISLDDIIIPEYCPVLGLRLVQIISKGHRGKTRQDNSMSIDRIDNTKGYVKGNICVISLRANIIKNNATINELEKILNYMKVNQNGIN